VTSVGFMLEHCPRILSTPLETLQRNVQLLVGLAPGPMTSGHMLEQNPSMLEDPSADPSSPTSFSRCGPTHLAPNCRFGRGSWLCCPRARGPRLGVNGTATTANAAHVARILITLYEALRFDTIRWK